MGFANLPSRHSNSLATACAVAAFLLVMAASRAFAVQCPVVHQPPPSNAQKALLAADYSRAENLFRSDLAAHPGDVDATVGLVHTLLREQKVEDAAALVQNIQPAGPASVPLLTLRGEVEYRQGTPWTAAQTVNDASRLDPCNARNMLLVAQLARINSLYATASRAIATAHQIDPDDPEIRMQWLNTLPLAQRIAELQDYLSESRGNDPEEVRNLHFYLDRLQKDAAEPHPPCRLASSTDATEIPFIKLMADAVHMRAFGLEVKLNNRSARLEIDTGAGGLLISRSVAEKAGLKSFSATEMGGIGSEGRKSGYTAYADSIRIGNLEFQNCAVRVIDSRNVVEDIDGLIGMDVFSRFLVTLDFPMHKLLLGPLPPRPDQPTAPAPTLNTTESEAADSAAATSAHPARPPAGAAATPAPTVQHGPYDRYIAPTMKDYTMVYRVGHNLILPASLNAEKLHLFIMDTGAWSTTISPQAAREVTKVHGDNSGFQVRGINGKVDKVYMADAVTFRFAHLEQKAREVVAFDTSGISKNLGLEISGFLGATTLDQLTIHIDYRDGLVKFDYDPKRGYHF